MDMKFRVQNSRSKQSWCCDLDGPVDYAFSNKKFLLGDVQPGSGVASVEKLCLAEFFECLFGYEFHCR